MQKQVKKEVVEDDGGKKDITTNQLLPPKVKQEIKEEEMNDNNTNQDETGIKKRKRKNINLKSKQDDNRQNFEIDNNNENNPEMDNQQDQQQSGEEVKLFEEPLVSNGLLATIQFASMKGFLEERRAGRSKDKSHKEEKLKSNIFQYDEEDIDFVIRHTDEFGRELTPKEAYRQFSHSYHGNKPKRKKRAKEKLKVDMEKKLLSGKEDNTSLKVMEEIMKETKQPYVVMDKDTFIKTTEVRARVLKENKQSKKKRKKDKDGTRHVATSSSTNNNTEETTK
ncbi:hypothetical protein ABK040_008633 [Willaertia magna]